MKINKSIPQIKRNISDAKTQIQRHESGAESASAKQVGALGKLQAKEKAFATATANMEKIGAKKSSLDAEIKDLRAQAAKAIAGDVSPLGRNALKQFSSAMSTLAKSDAPQADVTVGELRADKTGVKTKESLLSKADALQKKSNSYKGIFKSYGNTINSLAIDVDHAKSDAAAQGRVVANHMAGLGEATATLSQNESELKGALAMQGAGNAMGAKLADVNDAQAATPTESTGQANAADEGMLTGAEVLENLLDFAKTMLTVFVSAFSESLAEKNGGPLAASMNEAVQEMTTQLSAHKFSIPTKTPKSYSPPSHLNTKLNDLDIKADGLRSDANSVANKVKSGKLSLNEGLSALKGFSDAARTGSSSAGEIMAERSIARAGDLTPSDAVKLNIGGGEDLRDVAQNMIDGANASGRAHAATFNGEAIIAHPGDEAADVVAELDQWRSSQTQGLSAQTAHFDIEALVKELLAATSRG